MSEQEKPAPKPEEKPAALPKPAKDKLELVDPKKDVVPRKTDAGQRPPDIRS